MRLHHILFLILLVLPVWSYAYELVTLQGISNSKKSFITRKGKRQGIFPGMTATFMANDVSLLARAVSVSGNFAQWQVINEDATVPWEKGTLVTWYSPNEYLWTLQPEKERQKYIKSVSMLPRKSFVFKGSLSRGLNESVSGVEAQETRRGGYMGEVYFEKFLTHSLSFDAGIRFEREIVNYTGVSYTTTRSLLIGDLLYYFNAFNILEEGRFYVGGGFGYGLSRTASSGLSQTGPVGLLPGVKAGINLPLADDWDFLFDGAFESLQTQEEQEDGRKQSTTQTNLKVGFGLRRYY
jgi:hypothetical protein